MCVLEGHRWCKCRGTPRVVKLVVRGSADAVCHRDRGLGSGQGDACAVRVSEGTLEWLRVEMSVLSGTGATSIRGLRRGMRCCVWGSERKGAELWGRSTMGPDGAAGGSCPWCRARPTEPVVLSPTHWELSVVLTLLGEEVASLLPLAWGRDALAFLLPFLRR